jgi:hypothetical protein
MDTREYLINKLKKELTVAQYVKKGDWFLIHIDKILTKYSYLKVGAIISVDINGYFITQVKDLSINYSAVYGSGIVVETDYGNVLYYETKEPTEKELQEYLQD